MSKNSNKILSVIFLTVFLDMLGISIIIPVLPALFFSPDTLLFNAATSVDLRSILYGLLIATFPLMQFFGAPILGSLSDKHGRRPILKISLFGAFIGYILFAIAVIIQDLTLLFISRMIPGFMGGNIAIVMSAISDVSDEKSKPKNFGLVGTAFGLGFIIGPTVGGILADNSVVYWFNHATPFFFTAGLTLINLILVQFIFRETLVQKSMEKISAFKGFHNINKAFKIPSVRQVLLVVLLLSLGFTFFTQFFSVHLIQQLSFSEKDLGFIFGWAGFWLVVTQGVIVRKMSGKVNPRSILLISMLTLSLGIALCLVPRHLVLLYAFNAIVAISWGMTSPNISTVVSDQAGPEKQGEILGIQQSMNSLGHVFPPLIAGYLNTINGNLPLIFGAAFVFLAWLQFVFINKKTKPLLKVSKTTNHR